MLAVANYGDYDQRKDMMLHLKTNFQIQWWFHNERQL